MLRSASVAALLAFAGPAGAQSGWLVDVRYGPGQDSVNPLFPRAEVWFNAYFPPSDFAFAAARPNFHAGDGVWDHLAYGPNLYGG